MPQVKWLNSDDLLHWIEHKCFWHPADEEGRSMTRDKQILSLLVPPSTSSLQGNSNAWGNSTRTCPYHQHLLAGGSRDWLPGLRHITSISLVPHEGLSNQEQMRAWGGPAHEKPECQCETACRGRFHEGCERTKTQETVHKSLWQCVCVCVCVRKKTDVRAGRGATSFHSTNEHVWVHRSLMKSAKSPPNGVRVWKSHRTQMNQKLW